MGKKLDDENLLSDSLEINEEIIKVLHLQTKKLRMMIESIPKFPEADSHAGIYDLFFILWFC